MARQRGMTVRAGGKTLKLRGEPPPFLVKAMHGTRPVAISENSSRMLTAAKKVRTPSREWRGWVLGLLDDFEILDSPRGMHRSALLGKLTEYCELERLDAVRLDREQRTPHSASPSGVQVAHAALAEIDGWVLLDQRVQVHAARLTALEDQITCAKPLPRKKRPRKQR